MSTKVVAFPFGGGNKYTFNNMRKILPPGFTYNSPDLPGRCARVDEPFLSDMNTATEFLLSEYHHLWSGEFIFIGHCLGALIAFELARKLEERGLPLPAKLFVCNCVAPDLVRDFRLSLENDSSPVTLLRKFGVDEKLLADENFVELLSGSLAADMQIYNGYEYVKKQLLHIPVTVIVDTNNYCPPEHRQGWQRETTLLLREITLRTSILDPDATLSEALLQQ